METSDENNSSCESDSSAIEKFIAGASRKRKLSDLSNSSSTCSSEDTHVQEENVTNSSCDDLPNQEIKSSETESNSEEENERYQIISTSSESDHSGSGNEIVPLINTPIKDRAPKNDSTRIDFDDFTRNHDSDHDDVDAGASNCQLSESSEEEANEENVFDEISSDCDSSNCSSDESDGQINTDCEDSEKDECEDADFEDSNLYPGSSVPTATFNSLLLGFSQKHHLSNTAVNDLLQFMDIILPQEHNAPSSSYSFYKYNNQCSLSYTHKQLCPLCHKAVLQDEKCSNVHCTNNGKKVEPITFFTLPIKPQIQRLVNGKYYLRH